MRRIKFIVFSIVLLFLIILHGFGLEKSKDRPIQTPLLSKDIKDRISKDCQETNPKECAKYSMKLTSELLYFAQKNDIENGKANCIGYAVLCSWICNYALQVNNLKYKAKPVVGYVTFYGINLCDVLKVIVPKNYKNFVKDHDFVEIQLDDKVMYFDASLYDYYINCTTYR